MIRLLTTFYNEKDSFRAEELYSAISENLSNPVINQVCILNEGGDLSRFSGNDKLLIKSIKERPCYSHFYSYINSITEPEDINIIANTDIVFEKNIEVLNYFNFENRCMALARYEINDDGRTSLFNRNDAQDVWIFKGSVRPVAADFFLGVPRCDNRIMYELKKAGYDVLNPAFSIKTFHFHKGFRVEYGSVNEPSFVQPPYAYLYPHNLYSLAGTIRFNLSHSYKLHPYRYDIKKLNRWWPIRLFRKICKVFFHTDLRLIGYN